VTYTAKIYTFIIKDTLLPKNPSNGREQSTISYEYDFEVPAADAVAGSKTEILIPWDKFKATYRGKPLKDAPDINLRTVRRFSIMCRSFFEKQAGDFDLEVLSISAVSKILEPNPPASTCLMETPIQTHDQNQSDPEKGHLSGQDSANDERVMTFSQTFDALVLIKLKGTTWFPQKLQRICQSVYFSRSTCLIGVGLLGIIALFVAGKQHRLFIL
jgi:hypothetical protein